MATTTTQARDFSGTKFQVYVGIFNVRVFDLSRGILAFEMPVRPEYLRQLRKADTDAWVQTHLDAIRAQMRAQSV